MEKLKRKRSDNWVEEDKMLLKDLVKERASVIENKNTDTNTNNKKKKSWTDIEESFNSLCQGSQRNVAQLKAQWTLTKIQAKKEMATYRMEVKKTGGGPPPADISASAKDIEEWLPQEFAVDENIFDSDNVTENVWEKTENEENLKIEFLDEEHTDMEDVKCNDFLDSKETKPAVEGSTSKTVQRRKRKHMANNNMEEVKIKQIVETDVECRKELHTIQMENERKKARNLDLKYELIQEKIKFYQKRLVGYEEE